MAHVHFILETRGFTGFGRGCTDDPADGILPDFQCMICQARDNLPLARRRIHVNINKLVRRRKLLQPSVRQLAKGRAESGSGHRLSDEKLTQLAHLSCLVKGHLSDSLIWRDDGRQGRPRARYAKGR